MYKTATVLILALVLVSFSGKCQDTLSYTWREVVTYPVDSTEVWSVDQLQNVFVTRGSSLQKYDSTGVLKFQQSIKSYGKLKSLASVNSMKLIYFSEEQQTLCFLDNTLTQSEDCIDLVEFQVTNAEWIAASSRPELLWVYDNVNSTLKLIPLDQSGFGQEREIVNLKGLLGISNVDQIFENSGYLYLYDSENGVFILDYYGGLVNTIPLIDVDQIDCDRSDSNLLYFISDGMLTVKSMEPRGLQNDVSCPLPLSGITEFTVVGNFIYLRSAKNVHKYSLLLNN